jgi:glucose-1-phosphate thymidylyltransferase
MWGIVPAAGIGNRIQPLAFSKELLPVGSRLENGVERPCAVSEYLVERMILGGADKICFVVSPGKADILAYYGGGYREAPIAYVVQPRPAGLCDAIFRAAPLVHPEEPVLVGLPDTIWFPAAGLRELPEDVLSFLLFPVDRPQVFDAVLLDGDGRVLEIQVKRPDAATNWIWGAFKMPGRVLHELHALWLARNGADEYLGTLVNAYLAQGGRALGIKAGQSYVDVGTLGGYRSAITLLSDAAHGDAESASGARVGLAWPAGRLRQDSDGAAGQGSPA